MANKVWLAILSNPIPTLKPNLQLANSHWRQSVLFGLIWGSFLAIHTFVSLHFAGWQELSSILKLTLLIFLGTTIGGAFGWFFSVCFAAQRIEPKRFATSFVLILICTIGAVALLFAYQYRLYYSQWHNPVFSKGWFIQLLFTGLSSFYLFAVQGLRLLLPFAPLGLFIASLIFVKRAPTNSE